MRRDKALLDTWDSLSLDNRQPLEAGAVRDSHSLTGLSQVSTMTPVTCDMCMTVWLHVTRILMTHDNDHCAAGEALQSQDRSKK